ncbi:MAG TPA: hypothetical protein VJX66_01085 [Amycolatopsis sp.]|nr:hypothetical protein [Amycolatopsis sp.]
MGNTVIEVTDEEITLLRHALRHYLSEFGHEEAVIVRKTKELIAKLPEPSASPA